MAVGGFEDNNSQSRKWPTEQGILGKHNQSFEPSHTAKRPFFKKLRDFPQTSVLEENVSNYSNSKQVGKQNCVNLKWSKM